MVPTGAVVGAAAAVRHDHRPARACRWCSLVATGAALLGDLVTFTVCRFGGPAAVRWVARGQNADRIAQVRDQFRQHGWQIIVVGRLLPAGRIPVLLAAGALAYPWRRLVPAATLAAFLWAVAYALLGVVSGGIFDSPLIATLLATAARARGRRGDQPGQRPPRREARRADATPRRRSESRMTRASPSRGRVLRTGRTVARVRPHLGARSPRR